MATASDLQDTLLGSTLALLVPLAIMELHAKGGPTAADYREAGTIQQVLAERADVLLFGGGRKGEAGQIAAQLARGIALLSFWPGGVRLFGQHWDAEIYRPVGEQNAAGVGERRT